MFDFERSHLFRICCCRIWVFLCLAYKTKWVFPNIGVGPQNGWLIIVPNPIKWMIWGAHPYFWKHPNLERNNVRKLCTSAVSAVPNIRVVWWLKWHALFSPIQRARPKSHDRFQLQLPSLKLTAKAPENRPKPNRKVVFQPSIFRGYVSFREGNLILIRRHGYISQDCNIQGIGKDVWAPDPNVGPRKMGNPGIISPITPGYFWVSYPQESQGWKRYSYHG